VLSLERCGKVVQPRLEVDDATLQLAIGTGSSPGSRRFLPDFGAEAAERLTDAVELPPDLAAEPVQYLAELDPIAKPSPSGSASKNQRHSRP
jgi:hypothetical protein